METFYIFLISYTLQGHPVERTWILENSEQCQIAIRANEPVSNALNADLFCIDTGKLSASIRPKHIPEGEAWKNKNSTANSEQLTDF